MTRLHCPKCGSFTSPMPEQRALFQTRGGLPLPANDNGFHSFHAASQRREDEARRKGVCRAVGAERRARRDFTTAALMPLLKKEA
ncbi:hypothetical protein [Brevundimonas sp. FT23028]|uniref:hypothetical protein n=1 Tax=Brevundimonas sp. FT23028 TaxID=3393748 RepID=UPI003B589421